MSTSTEAVCSSDADPAIDMAEEVALEPKVNVSQSRRDAYFDSEHLTKDLGRRTVRGGAITLTAQGAKFALRLGSTAILARLLIHQPLLLPKLVQNGSTCSMITKRDHKYRRY